eukprot:GHVU01079099.1.p1 GENE.GHVU01079099.1~~GHVU01079099.1.p1  ORF type:complete len:105 (-),score=20.50 GHVU01079099.1:9-293(-)
MSAILDVVGLSGGTYTFNEDWEIKDTAEINQFRRDVSKDNFDKANEEYNKIVAKDIEEIRKDKDYLESESDDQVKAIQKIKRDAKTHIFNKYNP